MSTRTVAAALATIAALALTGCAHEEPPLRDAPTSPVIDAPSPTTSGATSTSAGPAADPAQTARDAALLARLQTVPPRPKGTWRATRAQDLADLRGRERDWARDVAAADVVPASCGPVEQALTSSLVDDVARAAVRDGVNGVQVETWQLATPAAAEHAVDALAQQVARCRDTTKRVGGFVYEEHLTAVPVVVPGVRTASAVSAPVVSGKADGDAALLVRAARGPYVVEVYLSPTEARTASPAQVETASRLVADALARVAG